MKIEFDRVTVKYADATPLNELSLTLGSGSTAIMGPSGSGKSTLLRLIAGSQAPSTGVVTIDGTVVKRASWSSAGDSRVALIHQDYRLVPFLTVRQNLLLAAELRGMIRPEADVKSIIDKVRLPASMAGRLPTTLSGGEQQRVSIARALMANASIVLADEPTGALDAKNSVEITELLAGLGKNEGLSVVVATHDLSVAERLDRCLSLNHGTVAQTA